MRHLQRMMTYLRTFVFGCLMAVAALSVKAEDTWRFAVQITAVVQTSPPRITLTWLQDKYGVNSYTVYRKAKADTTWGSGTTLAGSITTYVDNNVTAGSSYEYKIVKAATSGYSGYGYIYAG